MLKKKRLSKSIIYRHNIPQYSDNMSTAKKKKFKNSIRKRTPNIFSFTINDSFIYEPLFSNVFYQKLNDYNDMKLDKFELCFLDGYINSFNKSGHISYIEVLPFFKELMEYVVLLKQNILHKIKLYYILIYKIHLQHLF